MDRNDNNPLELFDFRVHQDDFVLYELGRLIEEDRAELEDADFRRLIEEGIAEHIERRPEIRAGILERLKAAGQREGSAAMRMIGDPEAPLSSLGMIVRSYIGYLFRRLDEAPSEPPSGEEQARELIDRWLRGEILREQLTKGIAAIGPPAIAPLADWLFDASEDRTAAETAIDLLGSIQSAISARVLAHAISEPILEEDLESKAYGYVRTMWPLPRLFVLYSLRPHTHEDLPYRWFQLLVEKQEPVAVDRILEELVAHSANPDFQEDLRSLLELLGRAKDPAGQDKVLQVLNSSDAPRGAVKMLEDYLGGQG
jgi:hypothetical protein